MQGNADCTTSYTRLEKVKLKDKTKNKIEMWPANLNKKERGRPRFLLKHKTLLVVHKKGWGKKQDAQTSYIKTHGNITAFRQNF